MTAMDYEIKFQFHIGAIRSHLHLSKHMSPDSFNSILVQLEVKAHKWRIVSIHRFQFHIGAIRSQRLQI